MRKKYLKTIEDIEALRNTDTKIYCTNSEDDAFWKFVNGVLCLFKGRKFLYNDSIWLSTTPGSAEYYIEIEDEPSKDDIGKLGWFWDDDADDSMVDVLVGNTREGKYRFEAKTCSNFKHFRPLTPEEVEKYTGYKVVKEG